MLGEKLLTKLWETLADKGIGSLLEPWHKTRLHDVELKAKYKDIIMTADAEKKANDIKNGKLQITDSEKLTLTSVDEISTHIESAQKIENIKKEINVAKAIVYAEKELENDTTEVSEEEIDEDWLYKWKNNASEVSKEELHRMWGSLLAGEVKSPGKYSLRTMGFLKNISQKEAILLEKLGQFIFSNNNIIYEEYTKDILEQEGLSFNKLLELQELGILMGVDSSSLRVEYDSINEHMFSRLFVSCNKALIVEHEDCKKKITLKIISITKLGKEVLSLGSYEHNKEYLFTIGKQCMKNGFTVKLADIEYINNEQVKILTSEELKV